MELPEIYISIYTATVTARIYHPNTYNNEYRCNCQREPVFGYNCDKL